MEGYDKVEVLRVPAPGRQVSYAGVAFNLPADGTPREALRQFWRKPLREMGRTTHAQQDEAVRAIIDLASTHVGVEREPGKIDRVRLETVYLSQRTGEVVTLSSDPKTGELRVHGETPEEEETVELDEPIASEATLEADALREQEEAREVAQQENALLEDAERGQEEGQG